MEINKSCPTCDPTHAIISSIFASFPFGAMEQIKIGKNKKCATSSKFSKFHFPMSENELFDIAFFFNKPPPLIFYVSKRQTPIPIITEYPEGVTKLISSILIS